MKSFMPICVNVAQTRIVMIGGGRVALKKLQSICQYTDTVYVFAQEILPEIRALAVVCRTGDYSPSALDGAALVYACTDDRELNRRIGDDARSRGALVNVADDPENCDFISPAIFRQQEMSIAVSSGGGQVKKTVRWRDTIRRFLLNHPPDE